MDISELFRREILSETIKVHARYLGSNLKDYLIQRIRETFEDKVSLHGFVKRASIEILSLGTLQSENQTFRGFVNANVMFSAMVVNPPEKTVLKARIININRFGVLATCEVNGKEVLQVVVPKNIVSIRSVSDMNNLAVGDSVSVEILKRKLEINELCMYAIGRIVEEHPRPIPELDDFSDSGSENDDTDTSIDETDNGDIVELEIEESEDVEENDEEALVVKDDDIIEDASEEEPEDVDEEESDLEIDDDELDFESDTGL